MQASMRDANTIESNSTIMGSKERTDDARPAEQDDKSARKNTEHAATWAKTWSEDLYVVQVRKTRLLREPILSKQSS
jgi:hypothetical protein